MLNPEGVHRLWTNHIRIGVEAVTSAPIPQVDFLNIVTKGLIEGVKPGYIIANLVRSDAETITKLSRQQFPSFPHTLIHKAYPLIPVQIMYAEDLALGRISEEGVSQMVAGNAREDGIQISRYDQRELVSGLRETARLLSVDPTGKQVVDWLEPRISEMIPTSESLQDIYEELVRSGVKRYRNYLEIIQRLPLL